MAVINKEIAYMALPLSIRRGNPFPLDEYSVWYNYEQMENYAKNNPVAYVGQVLVYVNESKNTVDAYVIQNIGGVLMKLAASTASGDLASDVLELQGKVSDLETTVGTKAGGSSIVATNLWAAIEEIKAAYESADTAINENLTNNYYNKTETDSKIDEKIATKVSSTYKAAGSIEFSSLPVPSAAEEGKVYNISDAFTTNENFVEGAGQSYPAGTNVVCINSTDGAYKWDVLAGFVDLSNYATTESVTSALNNKVDKIEGSSLVENTDIAKLKALATINDVTEELEIAAETNTLGIKSINVDKLIQTDGSELILNGGTSGASTA